MNTTHLLKQAHAVTDCVSTVIVPTESKTMSTITSCARRWPATVFCTLTVSLSFAVYLLPVPRSVLPFLMVLIPATLAVALAFVGDGQAGVRLLLGKLAQGRVNFRWLAIALGLALVVRLGISVVALLLGWIPDIHLRLLPPSQYAILAVIVAVAALLEEFAWRGYLMPKLLSRHSALGSSLRIGTAWGIPHLALILPGMMNDGVSPLATLLSIICMSMVITWLYVQSGGSIILTTWFHAAQNFLVILNDGITLEQQTWLMVGITGSAALLIVVLTESHRVRHRRAPSASTNLLRFRLGVLVLALALTVGLAPAGTVWARAAGQATQFRSDSDAIDAFIETQMRELRIPGLALGITHGDQVVYLKGYGDADPSGRPVTPQTPFVLNSISKSFVALAILQLVEAGRISLDAPVQQYLPWFAVADTNASTQITVRHLLNQTSGLPESASYTDLSTPASDEHTLEERVRRLSETQLNRPVGSSFEYTDANYDVLGLIVQSVSGQAYSEYVQQHILAPLTMNQSATTKPSALPAELAVGHRSWFGLPVPFTKWYTHASLPSGDLISTAEDMTHYLIAHLNKGRYARIAILSPEGIASLHEPAVRQGESDKFYGMGWESRPSNGIVVVRHDGTSANYYADVLLEPVEVWGVVLLLNINSFNMVGGRIHALSGGILSLLRGETPPALPAMHHPIVFPAMVAILLITSLLSIWMAWLIFVWRRQRPFSAQVPSGWRRYVAVSLPFLLNLGWALLLLLGVPQLTYPLPVLRTNLPDFGYSVLVSGALAIVWCVAWFVALYRMVATGKSGVAASADEPIRA